MKHKPSLSFLFFSFCLTLFLGVLIAGLACRLNLDTSNPIAPQPAITTPGSPQQISLEHLSLSHPLSHLQSYRANLIVEFEGTRNGQPATGRLESLTKVTRTPAALYQYLKIDTTVSNSEIISGTSEFYRLADRVYVKKGDEGNWFSFTDSSVSPDALGFFALDRLIILPATLSQPPQAELLDDLRVQHFTFTQHDLAEPNIIFEKAEGDLWLAEADHSLIQYVISATLSIVIPDPKAHIFDQGQLNLRYTLSDINAEFTITLPESGVTENETLHHLPRLADAEIVSIFPTFIEYTSAITPINAALFYRDELAAQGWTEDNTEIFNEKARLWFSKENQNLTVVINPQPNSQQIKVLLDLTVNSER